MTTPVTSLRRRAGRIALLTAVITAALFALVRRTQFFAERIELPLYDALTTLTHPWKVGHPDVVLVTIRDHRAPFWPITDARLADTLNFLINAGATCIGVDLKRDDYRADPVDPSGASRLYDLAATHDQVIWIRAMAGDGSFGPPPFLLDLRQKGLLGEDDFALRATLADYPADLGMVVRRGYLAAEEIWSLPAALANLHAVVKQPERAEEFGRRMGEIGGLRPDAGGYWIDPLPPDGIGDQFLLKFGPGMDAAFRDYPLEDLPGWDPEALRAAFGGKIVLLGTHDSSTAKDEAVVIGDENLRGVKLHALAAAQLLRELTLGEAPVRHTPEWLEAALTVATALLAAAGVWLTRLPSLWKSVLFPVGLPLLCFGVAAWCMSRGCWLPPGAPMVAGFTSATATLAILLAVDSRERNAMFRMFERHVGPEIARRIWAANEQLLRDSTLPAKPFALTAMFSDLRGFSQVSAAFHRTGEDARFHAWLNGYLGPMVDLVHKHRGFIKQFAGDGIFVLFGYPPETGENHAADAVRCAMEMADAVQRLNAFMSPGLPPYHVRAGIHSGEVFNVVLGGTQQFDFSFSSPTINRASRIEKYGKESFDPAAGPFRILISETTRSLLPAAIRCQPFSDGPADLNDGGDPELVWQVVTPDSGKFGNHSASNPHSIVHPA